MVYLFSGTPGSGKSLHTAKDIIDRAILGKPVIGNFPVDLSRYCRADYTYCPNDALTPEFLIGYSREYFKTHRFREGAILLVIDECQLIFNAREWQQSGRAQWLSFFTQHRKYGYNIYLVAQFDRMIDRQIRSLIEYECIHRKASNFGFGGKLFSLAAGGNLFVCVTMWYPLKARIGSEFFKCKKRYYRIYDSYASFAPDGGATGGKGAPAAPPPERSSKLSGFATKTFILLRSLWLKTAPFRGHLMGAVQDLIEDLRQPEADDYSYPGGRDALGWTQEQRERSKNLYNPLRKLEVCQTDFQDTESA